MIAWNMDIQEKRTASNMLYPLWPSTSILLAILSFLVIPEQNWPVVLPMLAAVIAAIVFLWILWVREGTIPFLEIGTVYVGVVTLYTLYPLIGYLVNGLAYTPFNDNRLFNAQPEPNEVGTIGWYYVVHLISCIGAYLSIRGRLRKASPSFVLPDRITFFILVGFYLLISVFFLYLNWRFGISESSYIGTYLIFKGLPFGLAQISSLFDGARITVQVAILCVLFGNYSKYWPFILVWLGWIVSESFLRLGSRTELILLIIAMAILYHYLVRKISFLQVVTGGLGLLALFISFGLLRMDWLFSGSTGSFNPFAYASEFEVIFANAYDFRYGLNGASFQLPPGFYLADILVMIPRQLLPFEKISPSEWYVSTFYPLYADLGGGLALGTICESLVGAGWVDAIARGAALGFILGVIHRRCILHRPSFWVFVFYVWLSTQMYQSFRHTTFFPFYLFVYRFLWVMVGTKILVFILKRGTRVHGKTQTQPA